MCFRIYRGYENQTVCDVPFDAIATSASVFCSQNMAQGSRNESRRDCGRELAIATIYGLLIGLVLIFGGRTLSMIFVKKSAADVLDASGNICGVLDISSGVSVS